jgi:hypothetical protein
MIAGPIRVISNATLTGAGTAPTVTGIVPCYGARQVDFKITAATGANMSATWTGRGPTPPSRRERWRFQPG